MKIKAMKKLVLLSIIIMLFTTCKKTMYKSWVDGQVVDQHTHKPIENVKVFLVGSDAGTGGSPSFTEIESVTTGSDGKYSFSFNRSEYQHYYLYAKPLDDYKYFSYGSYNDYIEISFSKKFRKDYIAKDIELLHCGYLTVNFNHTSIDTFLFISAGYKPQSSSYFNSPYTNYGAIFQGYVPNFTDNRTYVFCLEGNSTNIFSISKTKKMLDGTGYTESINQSFFIQSHDTTYYQFNY